MVTLSCILGESFLFPIFTIPSVIYLTSEINPFLAFGQKGVHHL